MPYSLEIIAEDGPLPRTEALLEWMRVSAPWPLEREVALAAADAGDRFELQVPFRCDEREARAQVVAAVRAAGELRLAVQDPQLGRRVAEADLEAVVERWRALRAIIPDENAQAVLAARPVWFPVAGTAGVLLLALVLAVVLGVVELFAAMVEADEQEHPGEYRDGQR